MKSYVVGMTDCLRQLERLEKAVDGTKMSPEMKRAVERLGNIGWATWHTAITNLGDIDDGTTRNVVIDSPSWKGSTLTIRGHGDNILFVEFGTGVKFNHATKYGQSYGFFPTSWSASPNGKGWLVGAKRKRYKGKWILPKGVIPDDQHGKQTVVHRGYMTKKYGWRDKFYTRKTPIYWAVGHRPANGMYYAMKAMSNKNALGQFKIELLK